MPRSTPPSPSLSPSPSSPSRWDRRLAGVGLVLAMTALAMQSVGLEHPSGVACVFQKAVLCAEFPSSGAGLATTLIGPPNTPPMWSLTTWLDMLLLLAYGATLVLGARRLAGHTFTRLAQATALTAVLGALLDVVENALTLSALASAPAITDQHATILSLIAGLKFTVLGLSTVGLVALAWPAWRAHPIRNGLLTLGALAALGGASVGWFAARAFELSGTGIALTLLALWTMGIAGLWRARTARRLAP